jgi:hypothetical protein
VWPTIVGLAIIFQLPLIGEETSSEVQAPKIDNTCEFIDCLSGSTRQGEGHRWLYDKLLSNCQGEVKEARRAA